MGSPGYPFIYSFIYMDVCVSSFTPPPSQSCPLALLLLFISGECFVESLFISVSGR